jgi:hypothetical protein
MLWNKAIQNNQQANEFMFLLEELAYERGWVKVTTTDGATIATVQPVP